MTASGCDLSNIGLNNQLLVNSKIHERTRNNSLGHFFDSTASLDLRPVKDESARNMALLPDLSVDFNNVDTRMICDEPKLSKEDPQETRHLKDLLLLHLDWIQQQQASLQEKDRQIQRLKQEKEAMKCRLERMQRRMALLRQKSTPSPSSKLNDQKLRTASPVSPSAQNVTPGRGSKRKLSFEPQSLNRKYQVDIEYKSPKVEMLNKSTSTDADTANSPLAKRPRHRIGRPAGRRTSFRHSQQSLQQPSRKCRSRLTSETSSVEVNEARPETEKAQELDSETDSRLESSNQSQHKQVQAHSTNDDGVHRTSIMYYVQTVPRLPSCEISPLKEQREEVKVPTFRIKHVPTGYQLEGTENLTDEAFLKRHQKPEADEKRRKRWDAQMLREQKMLERLQRRERVLTVIKNGCTSMSRRQQEREEIRSFLPDPKNAKHIEICDEIPVNAFGYAIPCLKPTEFSLPWCDAEKHIKEEKCRLSISKMHRK